MRKNDVYAWRIPRETRAELEAAARRQGVPLAAILDEIARRFLEEHRRSDLDDEGRQERLHAAAAGAIGTIRGGDPHRAERARETLRRKLARRDAR